MKLCQQNHARYWKFENNHKYEQKFHFFKQRISVSRMDLFDRSKNIWSQLVFWEVLEGKIQKSFRFFFDFLHILNISVNLGAVIYGV